jgi:DNA invertase Pin-like site-specific DNA recombinase
MRSKEERGLDFLDELRGGDMLICTETSRLSRRVKECLEIVDTLLVRKVRVVFTNQGLDLMDLMEPMTKLTLHMFSVMAEHENSLISFRTKEALRVLKARGRILGRRKGDVLPSKLDQHREKIREWLKLGLSLNAISVQLRCHPTTISIFCRKRYQVYRDISG